MECVCKNGSVDFVIGMISWWAINNGHDEVVEICDQSFESGDIDKFFQEELKPVLDDMKEGCYFGQNCRFDWGFWEGTELTHKDLERQWEALKATHEKWEKIANWSEEDYNLYYDQFISDFGDCDKCPLCNFRNSVIVDTGVCRGCPLNLELGYNCYENADYEWLYNMRDDGDNLTDLKSIARIFADILERSLEV